MKEMVIGFGEMSPEFRTAAGGKGGMLSMMYCAGYPVPEGFVILPAAFEEGRLNELAWAGIQSRLNLLRKKHKSARFAVRSSGLSEDSAEASFAGEFETVLNNKTDEDILKSIHTVYLSAQSERVQIYSSVQGVNSAHEIAIVVQLMIDSEISGVLFTVDAITGSRKTMQGNFVYGAGEQLVSGESNAETFSLIRPNGKYSGPGAFKKYALRLYKLASRLEAELGNPQDIEWAVTDGKLHILQARPITTLGIGSRDAYEINDSLAGDDLWINTNVGESISDVITPLSWSLLRLLDEEHSLLPGHYVMSGNICGRVYSNISRPLSMFAAFGFPPRTMLRKMSRVFGNIPEEIEIPLFPFSRRELIRVLGAKFFNQLKKNKAAVRHAPQFLQETPAWCERVIEEISGVKTRTQLVDLWNRRLWPYNVNAMWYALEAPSRQLQKYEKLQVRLGKLVGEEEASYILSYGSGSSELESLGPLLGISKVIKGELSPEQYVEKYGHRGPHEFELSIAAAGEHPAWLAEQIAQSTASPIDGDHLLKSRYIQSQEAWERFEQSHPRTANRMIRKLASASEGPKLREAVRSEWTRTFRINRQFALKVGEMAGIGEDIFFWYIDEILAWLSGGSLIAEKHLSARKEAYAKYRTLPAFPSVIRGRFDPFAWAKEPLRKSDYFDALLPMAHVQGDSLKGFAGAAGRIKGNVRVLEHPDEGSQLQPGEILVASTLNIGWTLLFPKAAAIVTNIGAPLSHAAIVARELGIPAVVGCGSATTMLKTGDRVLVDGGRGIVQILAE
ncbi:PEP/pyruvate-binding domain-containing protein [Fontibacillus sp. BL9]|uniref:PEP/pyruvate-binding domain-containing protein n=1 Tax=Fontibacillus sp. BL9 TaxID=3389971 RepID=UPI00397BB421